MELKVKNPFPNPRRQIFFTRLKIVRNYRVVSFLVFFIALVFSTGGCAERRLEDAFQGKLSSGKSNKIINEYCKSCHIHKNFDPSDHMGSVRQRYKRTYFRRTHECRACHYIEKNWVTNNYHRKTRNPAKANKGAYRDFEHAEIKQMKKNGKKKN